jgi:hypothetical protein
VADAGRLRGAARCLADSGRPQFQVFPRIPIGKRGGEGQAHANGQEARPHGQDQRFSGGIGRVVRSVAGASAALARDRSPVERDAAPDQFGGAASALSGARTSADADFPARTKTRRAPLGPGALSIGATVGGRVAAALSTLRSEPPSPAAPTPAIATPTAPRAPAARLGHRTHFGRGLTDGCDVRRRRYGRRRANERKPSCNNSSNHD